MRVCVCVCVHYIMLCTLTHMELITGRKSELVLVNYSLSSSTAASLLAGDSQPPLDNHQPRSGG